VSDNPVDGTSPDLPFELQSKLFDQLAAMSIAGAGLTVTLIGSILKNAPGIVWLAVIYFAVAAIVCITANIGLIDGLFEGKDRRKRNKWLTALSVMLIGMGAGSLGASVYLDGQGDHARAAIEKVVP
jgi:NADH:ubiquinone oxidoreductase subunit 6 (subunit J)